VSKKNKFIDDFDGGFRHGPVKVTQEILILSEDDFKNPPTSIIKLQTDKGLAYINTDPEGRITISSDMFIDVEYIQ
jgi:hypothetical protein